VADERALRILITNSKIQLLVAKLCSFCDGMALRERQAGARLSITPLIRNLLKYIFNSHIVLCMAVFSRVPEQTRQANKWVLFLEEILTLHDNQILFNSIKTYGQKYALQVIQRNNENACLVIRNLINKHTLKEGVFETVHLIMQYM